MSFSRRDFIKQFGLVSLLVGKGFERTLSALADPAANKLALLVAIDQYAGVSNLKGAVTDVELQSDLLINRFGFKSANILKITNQQATTRAIVSAFIEHLIKQAKPDDVVLFHFSGYGCELARQGDKISRGYVTFDQDLLESVLFGLARSLKTNRIILVLDTSYYSTNSSLAGDLRIRSYPKDKQSIISPLDEDLQKYFLSLVPNYSVPRIVLQAAQNKQPAAEISLNNFSAGLFTYALTSYLWKVSPNVRITTALSHASQSVSIIAQKQKPDIIGAKDKSSLMSYFGDLNNSQPAQAIVTTLEQDSKNIEIKLVGLDLSVLAYCGVNSCFSPITDDSVVVKVKSKEGQLAKCRLIGESKLAPGDLLKESIRAIARDIPLLIALDDDLDRIEKVDAVSAISSTVPIKTVIVPPGEITADCLLSKHMGEVDGSVISYMLSTPDGQQLPKTTVSSPNDALKLVITKLIPAFRQLLALKLWRLLLNDCSCGLPIRFDFDKGEQNPSKQPNKPRTSEVIYVPSGSFWRYRIENLGLRPIKALLVSLDPYDGIKVKLLTRESIKPQEIYQSPPETSSVVGLKEVFLVCAQSDFSLTQKLLETFTQNMSPNKSNYSLEIVQSILEDINQAKNTDNAIDEQYILDLKTWSTLKFIYKVN